MLHPAPEVFRNWSMVNVRDQHVHRLPQQVGIAAARTSQIRQLYTPTTCVSVSAYSRSSTAYSKTIESVLHFKCHKGIAYA